MRRKELWLLDDVLILLLDVRAQNVVDIKASFLKGMSVLIQNSAFTFLCIALLSNIFCYHNSILEEGINNCIISSYFFLNKTWSLLGLILG